MIQTRAAVLLVSALMASVAHVRVAHAQKSPTAQAAYARAQQHLAASRFKEAADELQTAVRYQPRFAMGWYVLASAQRRAGRCDEAVFAYRRYMELRPSEPDPYFGVGLCLKIVGDLEGATVAFRHFVDSDNRPTSRQFVEVARKLLTEMNRERPGAPPPPATSPASRLLVEARQLRSEGRSDETISRYRSAIAADRNSVEAHAELGALLVAARRPQDAVEPLRTAVRLAPTAASAWYNLAFALRESALTDESVQSYRRYITLRPKDPDPYYGLGRALASLGRDQEALFAFRTYAALETRPTELQWVKKARREIARIEAKAPAAAEPTPTTTPPPPRSARVPAPMAPPHGFSAPAATEPAPTRQD